MEWQPQVLADTTLLAVQLTTETFSTSVQCLAPPTVPAHAATHTATTFKTMEFHEEMIPFEDPVFQNSVVLL